MVLFACVQDSLGEDQKLKLEIARIIREDFLQQNSFTNFDYTCPLVKTIGTCSVRERCVHWCGCVLCSSVCCPHPCTTGCIVTFYEQAFKIIASTQNA